MRYWGPMALAAVTVTAVTGGAAAAPRAPNWNRGTPITITVTNDRFTPSTVTLRRGQHYILRIRNLSNRKHNFSSPDFFALARVAPRDSGWVTDNKVDLAAR
ncbi:MAG TPA: cupredoxin domain-containing protein [Sphingomonas sp.]|jgi:hypothetical protein|uniref:cupredoxin domain-containing protein n=1 Tax=Sphingomonas sp. TaxID=28214 RepID=UPI002ED8E7E4